VVSKLQISSSKLQINPKHQTPTKNLALRTVFGSWGLGFSWHLELEIWMFSGAWCLEFGALPSAFAAE
jgi:hypothetical protein